MDEQPPDGFKFCGMDSLPEENRADFDYTKPARLSKKNVEMALGEIREWARGKVMTPTEIRAGGGIPILQLIADYSNDQKGETK